MGSESFSIHTTTQMSNNSDKISIISVDKEEDLDSSDERKNKESKSS